MFAASGVPLVRLARELGLGDLEKNGSAERGGQESVAARLWRRYGDDAALLLDGMAFTEMASVEFPWFDMVRWTADFITTELRQHWTDDEWRTLSARP